MGGIVVSPAACFVTGRLRSGDARQRVKGALKIVALLIWRHRVEITMLPGMQRDFVSVSHRSLNEIGPIFGRASHPAIGRLDIEVGQYPQRTLYAGRVILSLRNPVRVVRIAISLFAI